MNKSGDKILSGLLSCFVGVTYFIIEVVWKTARGHPEGISWSMLVLALLLGLVMERMGAELPWNCPIWAQAILCGLTITAAEFLAGCVFNLWLGWRVWDYSHLPGNLLGQVCPQFAGLW
uniref:putative ABC transporter permease n=1 Tax=Oscillibacter sp. TaxID=1945593 RepID=UPI002899A74A